MSLRLKNATASQFPKDGWPFEDPITKRKFNGWEGSPKMIAEKVAEHRRGNPKLYPKGQGQNINEIVQEIFAQKVKVMPWLFQGYEDKIPAYSNQQPAKPITIKGDKCSCGATEFEAIYCPTCSGRRVTGYKCRSCGKSK